MFEVDEAALTGVARRSARALVLGNLFRDQLDRYGELELIGDRWRRVPAAARGGSSYNADDPLVAGVGRRPTEALAFGIDDRRRPPGVMQHAADSKWCGRCGAPPGLRGGVSSATSAHWRAPTAATPGRALDVVATRRSRSTASTAREFTLGRRPGRAAVRLPVRGLYNVYNALAAAAIGHAPRDVAAASGSAAGLGRFSAGVRPRSSGSTLDGRPALVLLIKNPAGANEVIRTLAAEPARKTLVVALNDRIADGRDVSWIWDVDFEELVPQVAQVVVTGTRAAEMAMRLKYAGLDADGDPRRARRWRLRWTLGAPRATGRSTCCPPTRRCSSCARLLVDRGVVRPYWEAA